MQTIQDLQLFLDKILSSINNANLSSRQNFIQPWINAVANPINGDATETNPFNLDKYIYFSINGKFIKIAIKDILPFESFRYDSIKFTIPAVTINHTQSEQDGDSEPEPPPEHEPEPPPEQVIPLMNFEVSIVYNSNTNQLEIEN